MICKGWPIAALLLLTAACSDDAPPSDGSSPTPTEPAPTATATSTPTPTPSPTPTPTPAPAPPIGEPPPGYLTYLDEAIGFAFHHPEEWEQSPLPEVAAVVLIDQGGPLDLQAFAYFETDDLPLAERLDEAVASFMAFFDAPRVEGRRTLVLDGGGDAGRADIVFPLQGSEGAVRLQVAERGLRTFLLAVSAPAAELERRASVVDAVLGSFVSFPPAPFGIARNRALTMPWSDPFTLDPAVSRETTSHLYVENLFSGLVRLDARLSVQPDLAERIDLDETGTVYTFTLRDGIAFHDGREITAEDVKYSIERAADPALMSDTAALYLGDIVGVRENLAGRASEVAGVEVVDSRTVSITIDAPKAFFLAKLTYPAAAVVDRLTVEPGGFEWWREEVNGSGPFQLERWEEGEVLVLSRFDAYHAPSSLEFAVFPVLQGLPMQMYESDEVDVALIGGANVDRALDPVNGLTGQLVVYPQFNVNYVGFNTREAPFDDSRVRLAFAMALDREALVETVLDGKVEAANGLLPPGLPGYSEDLAGIPYDPAAARELLAASRYAGGLPPIVYTTAGAATVPSVVQFMVDAWSEALGVDVGVELIEPSAYYYQLDERVEGIFGYGWVADYPDPENFLDLLLHSANTSNNVGGYHNAEFDALLERARTEQDFEARMALYAEAEELLIADAGVIPLYHSRDYALVKPHVRGFAISPLGLPTLRTVTVLTE